MKIKKFTSIIASCLILCCMASPAFSEQPSAVEVAGMMKKVFSWQMDTPKRSTLSWYNGTFYIGISAAYQATEDSVYLDALRAAGEKNGWKLGSRARHADDHCVGQAYLDLYLIEQDSSMIRAVQSTYDDMLAAPMPGREEWWWCDALFMDPPAMVRLTTITGNTAYLDLMNTMWWDTTELLYDTDDHLFFRDARLLNKRKDLFWSRGNGWVMAGLCRVLPFLPFLPEDYPDRQQYVTLFLEMSAKLATLQQEDGFWRSDLLAPDDFPEKESSGTGFFTYALAWGINQGLLSKEEYLPVVQKGWNALCGIVTESGKVEWVQAMGGRPDHTLQESTEPYAAGAFLLAGSEVLQLSR